MPVKKSSQFNRPVVGLMAGVAPAFQILQIKLNSDGTKNIQALYASYIAQANIGGVAADAQTAIANTFVQGRIAIIGESLELDDLTVLQLQEFHPFQVPILPSSVNPSNILFDVSFVNVLNLDFDAPIEIADGTSCSIILSQGYTPADASLAAPATKVASLNVHGKYSSQTIDSFYSYPR